MNATTKPDVLSEIGLLESTYNGKHNYVMNTRSLNDISTKDAWSVGRLASENE
jgi:hypothetical protein